MALFLVSLVLTLVLFGLGVHRRWREGLELHTEYLGRLVWVSAGFGSSIGLVVLPVFWVLISYAITGGPIERSLPPGTSPVFLLGLLLTGTLMTLVYGFISYRDHVFPYRIVPTRMRDLDRDSDTQPLERGPDDSPE